MTIKRYTTTILLCLLYGKIFAILRNEIKATNVKCEATDPVYIRFPYCFMKAVNRTTKLCSLRVVIMGPPVTNSTIFINTYKKANGYKPFVIKTELDACQFFAGRRYPYFSWMFDYVKPYTNINHTCPYKDDMIVEKWPVGNFRFPSVFPEGDYRWDILVAVQAKVVATVKLYFNVKEV